MGQALRHAALVVSAIMISGCGTSGQVNRDESNGQSISLSPAQIQIVRNGVKSMIANPESAEFTKMTALTFAGEEGVQICGHVKYKDATGADAPMQPFYLELREAGGKPVAERGQVGSSPSALSKVNFMCRRHGGG